MIVLRRSRAGLPHAKSAANRNEWRSPRDLVQAAEGRQAPGGFRGCAAAQRFPVAQVARGWRRRCERAHAPARGASPQGGRGRLSATHDRQLCRAVFCAVSDRRRGLARHHHQGPAADAKLPACRPARLCPVAVADGPSLARRALRPPRGTHLRLACPPTTRAGIELKASLRYTGRQLWPRGLARSGALISLTAGSWRLP